MMQRLVPTTILLVGLVGSSVLAQPSPLADRSADGAKSARGTVSASVSGVAGNASGLASTASLSNGQSHGTATGGVDGGKASPTIDPRTWTEVAPAGFVPGTINMDPAARTPRAPYPKTPTDLLTLPINKATGELSFTGRIIVKLRDEVGGRAPKAGPAPHLMSIGTTDTSAFDAVLATYGGSVQSFIAGHSDEKLRALELKAEARSGKAQPDLAGMVVVTVAPGSELAAGRALNDLDMVEFVSFERPLELHQNVGCDPNNPLICKEPGPSCTDGFQCNPDPGCAADPDPLCESGCKDVVCCELVTLIRGTCSDPDSPAGWDVLCAAYANLLCDGTIYDGGGSLPPDERYDPCFTDGTGAPNPDFALIVPLISGGCLEAHEGRGCNRPPCCFAVCNIDPICCTNDWDAGCVALASGSLLADVCQGTPDPGPTPDFTSDVVPNPNYPGIGEPIVMTNGWQAYTQGPQVLGDFADVPGAFDGDYVFLNSGFRGGGLDLDALAALQVQYAHLYQNDGPVFDRGKHINVGVVEFSAFVEHEDFTTMSTGQPMTVPQVIPEPNQTINLIEGGSNAPQHGTATLGECVAGQNGFGVTGIAYKAQGYFFPTLSIEEGARLSTAIASAGMTFEEGDVCNYSIGFPGAGPIITDEAIATMIAMMSDLGITSCMSAGNDNIAIAPAPFETGAVVVGACWPGMNIFPDPCTQAFWRYCKLGFSNYSDPEDALATVHLCAWGTGIATTGYGSLFVGANGTDPLDPRTNNLRKYSNDFNGTSGAAPIITGLAACLQSWALQCYGTPISPIQLRGVMAGNGRTPDQCNPLGMIFGPDNPDCSQTETAPSIGTFPDALECGFAIMNGQFIDGNATEVKILWGSPAPNSGPSSFKIRAVDNNYLKIVTKWATAGTTVDGLPYIATGHTTDVKAFIESSIDPTILTGVSLQVTSSSTVPFVIEGGFLYNWVDLRWDFVGVTFITPAGSTSNFPVNPFNVYKYLSPAGEVQARVWTTSLGNTGPHEIWHDMIQVSVNGATVTP